MSGRSYWGRLRTSLALIGYFLHRRRFLLAPMVVVLLIAGLLLAATGGLSYVAPFWYAIF